MRKRERFVFFGLAATAVATTCWLGGAPKSAVLFLSACTLLLTLSFHKSKRRFTKLPPLQIWLGACTLVTLLQVIPLPAGLIELLSPGKADIAKHAAQTLGVSPPHFISLSVDPSATLVEGLKFLAYLFLAFIAMRIASAKNGPRKLAELIGTSGLLVASIGIVHKVYSIDKLFGFYSPGQNLFGFLTPLINSNHLGSYLAMASFMTLGLTLTKKGLLRFIWGAGTVLLISLSLYQRSRSATVSLAVGILATAILFFFKYRRDSSNSLNKVAVFTAGFCVICALTLTVAINIDKTVSEFQFTNMKELKGESPGKMAIWRASEEMLWTYSNTGIGRGAFETAFTPYAPSYRQRIYSHAENEPLQFILDWGLLGGSVCLGLFLWVIFSTIKNAHKSTLQVCAFGALCSLFAHSFVDFALALPATMLFFIYLFAILSPAQLCLKTRTPSPWQWPARLSFALFVLLTIYVASPFTKTLQQDRVRLEEKQNSPNKLNQDDHAALLRHPADFFISALLANTAFTAKDPRSLKLINHSLYRNPHFASAHALSARMLNSTGHSSQSCRAYNQAIKLSDDPLFFLPAVLRSFGSSKSLGCLPTTPDAAKRIIKHIAPLDAELTLQYARKSASANPQDADLLLMLGQQELKSGLFEMGKIALQQAYSAQNNPQTAIAWSKVLIREKRFAEAKNILDHTFRTSSSAGDRTALLLTMAKSDISSENFEEARTTLKRAMGAAGSSKPLQRQVHLEKANLESALGNKHKAEWEKEQAAQ